MNNPTSTDARECSYCFRKYRTDKPGLAPDDGCGGSYHCGDCEHPYAYNPEQSGVDADLWTRRTSF